MYVRTYVRMYVCMYVQYIYIYIYICGLRGFDMGGGRMLSTASKLMLGTVSKISGCSAATPT